MPDCWQPSAATYCALLFGESGKASGIQTRLGAICMYFYGNLQLMYEIY